MALSPNTKVTVMSYQDRPTDFLEWSQRAELANVYLGTGVLPPKLELPGEGEELGRGHEAVAGILSQVIGILQQRIIKK